MRTRRQFSREFKHGGAWPILMMCEALGVSRSGFYAWLSRPRSRRNLDNEVLGSQVRQSFLGSDRTYGADVSGTTYWRWDATAVCTASNA